MTGLILLAVMPAMLAGIAFPLQGDSAEESGSLLKELMALENGAMERWRHGDPMGWAEISASEVTYVDPGLTKPIVGLAEYTKFLEGLKGKIVYQGSEFMQPRAVRYGDIAVLTYNYRSTVRKADGSISGQASWNTTEVYARQDTGWKIIHSHWSRIHHVPPERLEVLLPVELEPRAYPGVLGELMALETTAMERWRKGDPWGFTEISAPEVTYFDSGTPLRLDGLAALKQEYGKRVGKIHYDVMEFIEPTVQVHGDAAVLFYRFFDTFLRPDGSIRQRTAWNCTEIYAKNSGVWRIVHTHWSLINGRPVAE
jgi:ketosteroid isomerase-like protein